MECFVVVVVGAVVEVVVEVVDVDDEDVVVVVVEFSGYIDLNGDPSIPGSSKNEKMSKCENRWRSEIGLKYDRIA